MSLVEEFYSLLPSTVSADDIKARLRKSTVPSQGYLGPDVNLVNLPSGPTHIDVSLPPQTTTTSDGADLTRHFAADLELPTIVFVHGLCSASEMFDAVVEAAELRQEYRVVMYDIEGHGRSPLTPFSGEIDIDKLVKTLGEVMDWAGCEKFSLVGHSVGGFIAVSFAIAHPERVSNLFLISPANPMNGADDARQVWASFLPVTLEQGVSPWTDFVQSHGFDPTTEKNKPWVRSYVRAISRLTPMDTVARYVIAMYSPSPDFDKLRVGEPHGVRSLVLNGEYETGWPKGILSETAVKKYREVFRGHEMLIAHSSHYPLLENPEAVGEVLRGFLAKGSG